MQVQMRKTIAITLVMAAAAYVIGCGTGDKVSSTDIKLPTGFSHEILVDSLAGHPRHIVVTPNGFYVHLSDTVNGIGTVMFTESQSGKAEVASRFGNFGGTGIYKKGNYLYVSSNTAVYRYELDGSDKVIDPSRPDTIVSGLMDKDQHNSKSIVLDNDGNLYVNIGAPSNSCQAEDRKAGSMGMQPCPILDSAGGVWRFKAAVKNQTFKDGTRYATGLRNVVGLDWNNENNQLFVMQHGRDQLNTLFPTMYNDKQSAELPAECMFAVKEGDHCGWPYTYFDPVAKKKIVAPEYGGDGQKEAGPEFIDPAAAYPAHMAPNGLLFYTGTMFPEKYRNGAFIAFHGSWNRAPEPQKGFFVVFQPFKDGKPSGDWEIFADNFAGSDANVASGSAMHRPCGLAMGPDGSLYVTDDKMGTIYRIRYKG